MMEFPESEEDNEVFKPNGHEPGFNDAHEPSPSAHPAERKHSTIAAEEETAKQDEADDPEETDFIREIVEELSSAHRARRQTNKLAEQAASLVERYARQASTDSTIRDYATRLPKDPDNERGRAADSWSDGPLAPSATYSDNVELIEAMYKAASRANNERECGLQAALTVPLMIRQYPRAYRGLWPAIPALSLGMDMLARFLHRTNANRSLIMELPGVLRATLDRLAWYVSHRRAITSGLVSSVLAEQTGIWLASRPRRDIHEGRSRPYRSRADQPADPKE